MEELIIKHIRGLFDSGKLEPGDRLPAERKLAEKLGVSRAHVRSAYQKLEFYGIAKIYPQSGTVMVEQTADVIAAQFSGLMKVDTFDFASLVHVRLLLESEAVKLAVKNHSEEDMVIIREACAEMSQAKSTESRNAKDFAFHQAIARASHNPVISSLLLIITPDVLDYYRKHNLCSTPSAQVDAEHTELCEAIAAHDASRAEKVLKQHFKTISTFAKNLMKKQA